MTATPLLRTFSGDIYVQPRLSAERSAIDMSSCSSHDGPTNYVLRDAPLILGDITSRSQFLEYVDSFVKGVDELHISLDGFHQAETIFSRRLGQPHLRLAASV